MIRYWFDYSLIVNQSIFLLKRYTDRVTDIVEIKKSKTLLEKTVRRLKEESDNSDCNAEKEKNVSKKLALFSTGTALRKSVKDKEEQISELEKSLEKKEALLKST